MAPTGLCGVAIMTCMLTAVRRPGEWQDVRLDFRDFVFTFRGRLVTHHAPGSVGMPRHNIIAVRAWGRMCVDWRVVWLVVWVGGRDW